MVINRTVLAAAALALGFLLSGCAGVDTMEQTETSTEEVPGITYENRLIHEQSPYLLQHADNPVDWYPWGEEAFEKARKEDKPIFLSIGYSTCHWCHVMEHESFEDPEVGKLMNEVFVSIKVDREERPDIDGVYMQAAQMMTGRGGWPLTIIMTPDKKPFFAATYIPKQTRGQMTGMMDLIPQVQDVWINRRDDVLNSADAITRELAGSSSASAGKLPSRDLVAATFETLEKSHDPVHGGFGRAPKFPSPHNMLFLLRYAADSNSKRAVRIVQATLDAMRRGGIYDHLGGGFHRYATDRKWNVPHFEKMLYDQAMLTLAYAEAYQVTGEPLYKETVEDILAYVLRDMTSSEGAFFSAEDADSEGEEGKFYTWSFSELKSVLSPEELTLFTDIFEVSEEGNYREEASGLETGLNIIFADKDFSVEQIEAFDPVRKKLFEVREKRVHPFKDDKILTDWNGLMIAALATAGYVLDNEEYLDAARRSADFFLEVMRQDDGSLFHRYRQGEKGIPGYHEDYVFLSWGLLELYEATFEEKYLKAAVEFADYASAHFWDEEGLGFYSSSDEHASLIFREKASFDGAIPSGNSVAMDLFLRLGRMTSRTDMTEKGEGIAQAFSKEMERVPMGFTFLMSALLQYYATPREIIIVGDKDDPGVDAFVSVLRAGYYPNAVVLFVPASPSPGSITEWIPYLSAYTAIDGEATVYVCSNYACELPTRDTAVMEELLS